MIGIGEIAFVLSAAAAGLAAARLALRTEPEPPAPPSTMFVLSSADEGHGRWVEAPRGAECDCDSDEWLQLATRCGRSLTLHHCHKKAVGR
ncbi:hypothetical protein [Micrococcus luteus]|uniref:hypothetical protein n=1 Tax=Micrococcus luteus TaxID=1270 RepID=UPI003D753ABA